MRPSQLQMNESKVDDEVGWFAMHTNSLSVANGAFRPTTALEEMERR